VIKDCKFISEEITGDQTSYANILKFNKISEFREFTSRYLLQDSSRLTIELFANEVRAEEANFILDSNLSLNHREYEIVTLEQIRMIKSQY